MTDLKFECPHCQQRIQIEAKNAGRQIQCPGCNHLIRVPAPADAKPGEVQPQSGMTWDTFIPIPPAKKD